MTLRPDSQTGTAGSTAPTKDRADGNAGLHRLLLRQLRRSGLEPERPPADAGAWEDLLCRISRRYAGQEQDRYLLERSLDISSTEMLALYDSLRRNSESQIAAERDKLRAVIDGFSDGFCTFDGAGRLLGANPAAQRLLGADAARTGSPALAGFRLSGQVPNVDPSDPSTWLARVLSGQPLRDEKAVLRLADDRLLPVSLLLYPIIETDEVTGGVCTFRDLSALQDAELGRRRLALAVEASGEAIYITDLKGVIEYVNPAFTQITGWSWSAAIGQRTSILRSDATADAVYRALWQTISSGQTWSGRLLNRRRPGQGTELFWAQTTIAPIRADTGVPLGYVAVQRDITNRVAEEARQARAADFARLQALMAEILYRALPLPKRIAQAIDALRDLPGIALSGAYLVIAVGGERGTEVLLERDAPRDVLLPKLSPEALANQPRAYLMRRPTPALVLPSAQGGKAIGAVWLGLDKLVRPEPDLLQLLDQIAGLIGVAIADDRARRAAMEAAESKARFLANMSHEIRTPMNGVLGMLDLLTRTSLNAEQRSFLQTASASADSLLRIIDDILDFSKIEAGRLDLHYAPFDVRLTAESVITLFSPGARERGLALVCQMPTQVPGMVVGDATRVQQVLSNLVDNALKFTEAGEVSIQVSGLPDAKAPIRLRFDVVDTGIGMNSEQLERLFEPFVQADVSSTRRFSGTGLGLTIARQLVELMHGEIGVRSEPGRGSRFWFSLPFEQPRVSIGIGAEEPTLSGLRVLAVDDNAVNRKLLAQYLRAWKVEHIIAEGPLEVLACLRDAVSGGRPFQVAILDMQMPHMDGLSLGRRIKADPTIAETEMILLSSLGSNDSELRAAGFRYVLAKPMRQSALHDTLMQFTQAIRPRIDSGPDDPPPLRGRVLLAEDNQVNQKVAMGMLEKLGLQVDLAEDGASALERFLQRPYDLVLMDCQMPGLDGFEATRRIRSVEAAGGKHIPVVALTADAMIGDRERCIAAGMDDYIAKPITLEHLRAKLVTWLPPRGGMDDDGVQR